MALQRAGYRTALMGKYLNGYLESGQSAVPRTYVPPGWNQWDVAGFGYPEFDYPMNENGRIHRFGHRPRDYLTDVIARKVRSSMPRPPRTSLFFLELATFGATGPTRRRRATGTTFPAWGHPGRRISTRSPPTRRSGWRATRRWTGTSCARSTGRSAGGRSRCRRSTR